MAPYSINQSIRDGLMLKMCDSVTAGKCKRQSGATSKTEQVTGSTESSARVAFRGELPAAGMWPTAEGSDIGS